MIYYSTELIKFVVFTKKSSNWRFVCKIFILTIIFRENDEYCFILDCFCEIFNSNPAFFPSNWRFVCKIFIFSWKWRILFYEWIILTKFLHYDGFTKKITHFCIKKYHFLNSHSKKSKPYDNMILPYRPIFKSIANQQYSIVQFFKVLQLQ